LSPDPEVVARVVSPQEAAREARRWRREGTPVVMTNGCFDLLHVGHFRYLARARQLGHLIVGINSDASVRALKGPTRPIVQEHERAEALASLRAVDLVTIFDDLTAERLLELVRPSVYVKGADYGAPDRLFPEATVARRLGIRVELIDLVAGRSTSELVARLRGAAW
jgi:D-beta-D-heptose 7-phosphate kinase/D-beta-D-heptose 1-phosphate adenosyltransferase